MDASLFRWMNDLQGVAAVDAVLLIFSKYMYLIALAGCAALLLTKHRKAGLRAIGGAAIAYALCWVASELVMRDRPFVALEDVKMLFDKAADSPSFPSDSTAIVAAVAAAFASHRRSWAAAAWGVAIATGLSRVYAGHHYPTDVLAGWIVGAASTAAVIYAARKIPGSNNRGLRG